MTSTSSHIRRTPAFRSPLRSALAVAALAAAACAPAITTGVSTANDIKPNAYRTYTWVTSDAFPTGDPRLDNNPFFVETLKRTVGDELKRVGLTEAGENADLTVHFHATVQKGFDVYSVDQRAGYQQPGYEMTQQVREYEEGTVLVDLADRAAKRLIWRGWMQTDISGAIGNDTLLAERMRNGMRKLFEKFPTQCVCTTP
ncbi:MAG: DUF4136 domain-containing protein [Gemmatimonadota bacterium]|nr:DUF4136 domain-containing protein [Gemmatimonadota bacterium]